jgi:ribonuclease HI
MIHAIHGSKEVTIKSDSQLLVNQVKGIAKVKNIRFTMMMPIIHDLALHFECMNFDWIDRAQNAAADNLAKKAASSYVGVKSS